jgi:hypothetical protein
MIWLLATFGRGFYILDNYSPLRELNKELMAKEWHLFPVKDALLYVQTTARYGQGSTYFKAPNPDYGAVFTYYIKEVPKTLKDIRKEKEKELFKAGSRIPYPAENELRVEKDEISPYLIFTILDEDGQVVRKINKSVTKGINRVVWDLRYYSISPVTEKHKFNPTAEAGSSTLVLPGEYSVSITLITREGIKEIAGPLNFNVVPLNNCTLPAKDRKELVNFQKKANELARSIRGTEYFLNDVVKKVENIKNAIAHSPAAPNSLMEKADIISGKLKDFQFMFSRESDRPSSEENPPSLMTFNERLSVLAYTHRRSTSCITNNEKAAYDILMSEFPAVLDELKKIYSTDVAELENELEEYNVPWTPGRVPSVKVNN